MEAGLEHLSRGTGKHIPRVLAIVEPYFRSLETGRLVKELAGELGVVEILTVANKVRDDADRHAIREFCGAHEMKLVAEVPYDPANTDADRAGAALIDHAPGAPAVGVLRGLLETLHRMETIPT